MNSLDPNTRRLARTIGGPKRSWLSLGTVVVAAVFVGLIFLLRSSPTPSPQNDPQPPAVASAEPLVPTHAKLMAPALPLIRAEPVVVPPALPVVSPDPVPVTSIAPVVETNLNPHQLVADLAGLKPDASQNAITTEQAERFKQNMAQLIQQGSASVPAIEEFLTNNVDSAYDSVPGGDQLGYSSLRAGLLDALKQIGGPEAQYAMAQALQTTAVPAEILELAKNLEQQAPGQYSDQIVNAAREAVEMSSQNKLGTNVEVGPAFRVIQSYSDPHPRALQDSND
jgi:hypothetical protein